MIDADELTHSAFRGVVGALAMTGVRRFAAELGLIGPAPPEQLTYAAAPKLLGKVAEERRPALEDLVHWTVGAMGGVGFALLPETLRRAPWSGPAHGMAILLSFEAVVAPALGLPHHRVNGVPARLVLVADHLLYGLVLSELRERPRR
ncbi:hypothetical protein DSM104299_03856 [Baekduia alba]|uniref:hypothetical protein n=1 Tax=Baekduia alba TaxID=2997333 RepID=UPI0023414C8C|nr:hypothetical protein [Baekduia alba]WCB95114.1 hypothetical protein DSM104299_03856 [Baekduia alba]